MNEIIASPLFSIFLCIIAYKIGLLIQQKTKLGTGITTLYDGFPSFMFDKVQLDFIQNTSEIFMTKPLK